MSMRSARRVEQIAEAIGKTVGQDRSEHPAHDFTEVLIDNFVKALKFNNPKFNEKEFRDLIEYQATTTMNQMNRELEAVK